MTGHYAELRHRAASLTIFYFQKNSNQSPHFIFDSSLFADET